MMTDKFKVKYGNKESMKTRVLLCLSMGSCSVSLLDMLMNSLNEQELLHRGRRGFELVCCCIVSNDQVVEYNDRILQIVEKYGPIDIRVVNIDSYVLENDALHTLKITPGFETLSTSFKNTEKASVLDLLSSLPRSTQEDLLDIVKHDLYLRTAKTENCDTLLLAHSMTTLANETIALTVKGRGSMINERLTDGAFDDLQIIHPLRDILKTEIDKYIEFSGLQGIVIKDVDVSHKMTRFKTVNELTANYFDTLDKDYSEVISTVVKIGSKLTNPDPNARKCTICGQGVIKNPQNWLTNITVNDPAPLSSDEELANKQLWLSAQQERSENDLESAQAGHPVDVCYGCMVNLAQLPNGIVFPERDSDILNEYIL